MLSHSEPPVLVLGDSVAAAGRCVEQFGEDLLLGAHGADTAVRDDHHLVGDVQDALLVGNDENGTAGTLVHFLEDLNEVLEAPEIDACLGLVKDRELGSSGVDHGDLNALELASRQGCVDLTAYVLLSAQTHLSQVLAGLSRGELLPCRQGNEILDGDALEADGLLEGKADALVGTLGNGQIRNILAVQDDLPRGRGDDTRDDLGKGGLTAAVGAGDGHEAVIDGQIDVGQNIGLPDLSRGQSFRDTVGNIFQF